MDFFMDNLWILWLAVAAVMLLIEISTEALVSIWFVAGGVITAVFAVFVDNFALQVAVFLVCSGALLFSLRSLYRKKMNKKQPGDAPEFSMIGKNGTAEEDITEFSGKVLVGDVYWRAVCGKGGTIPSGAKVSIVGEDGTTLIVKTVNGDDRDQ